jgi:hypothetical protein
MTVWKARRKGDQILCGKHHPVTGRYWCQGVVAFVFGSATITPLPEMVEDPPGFLRPSARRLRKEAAGQRVTFPIPRRPDHRTDDRPLPRLPWQTACPRCKALVEVTRDLLG